MNVSENTNVFKNKINSLKLMKLINIRLVSLTVKWNNQIANSLIILVFCLPIILTSNCEFGFLHLHKHKNVKVE